MDGEYFEVPVLGSPESAATVVDLDIPQKTNPFGDAYKWGTSPFGKSVSYRLEMENKGFRKRHRTGEGYRAWVGRNQKEALWV